MNRGIVQWSVAAALLVVFGAGVGVYTSNRYMVDIDVQDVDSALLGLAVQTQTQLVFSSALITEGSKCPPIKGYMTVEDAMRAILVDSKIRIEYISGQMILLPGYGKSSA